MVNKEPVALGAIVGVVLNAILVVLSTFNVVDLNAEQTGAIFGLANAVTFVVVAVKTRSVVYAPYTVQQAGKPSPEDLGPPL